MDENGLNNQPITTEPTPSVEQTSITDMPTSTPPTVEPVKNNKKGLIIIIVVALLIVIAAVYFFFFRTVSKKQVINGTINKLFESAKTATDKLDEALIIDYKKDIISLNGDVKVSIETNDKDIKETLGDLNSLGMSYDLKLNLKELEGSLDLKANENDKDIAIINLLLKNENAYIKSNLFTQILRYDLSKEIDWDSIDIDKLPDYNAKALSKLISKTQQFTKDAIKDEYLEQSSVKETVDGVEIEGLKTTLVLNQSNTLEIFKSIATSFKNDDEALQLLAETVMQDKNEISASIDAFISQIEGVTAQSNDKYLLDIYTTKQGSFLGMKFTDNKGNLVITVAEKDKVDTIKFYSEGKETLKLTYNKKDKELKYKDEASGYEFTVKTTDNGGVITFTGDGFKLVLDFTYKISKEEVSESYKLEMSDNESNKLTLEANSKLSKGSNINEFSTTGSKNIKFLTDSDYEDMGNQIINNIKDTKIGTLITQYMTVYEEQMNSIYCSQAYACVDNGDGTATCQYMDDDFSTKEVICPIQ